MKRFYMEVTESGFTYLWMQEEPSETLALIGIRDFAEDKWELPPRSGERDQRAWLADTTLTQLRDWSFNLQELTEEEAFAELL